MTTDSCFATERFPRSSQYNPDWVLAGVGGGANPLWLTEWLCEVLDLRPGMKVLDLGCGRALSSIFLAQEFGVQVWATDLWYSASENIQRIRDANLDERVFPVRADARNLPFCEGFFDAIVSIDAFMYFGTDDLYLNYLARFIKPEGQIGIALAGFMQEIGTDVPQHLRTWWSEEMPYCLHSASWWGNHWSRTGIVDVSHADSLADGWQYWLAWFKQIAPENEKEMKAIEADAGRYFGYARVVGRRRADARLIDFSMSLPTEYKQQPLRRLQEKLAGG